MGKKQRSVVQAEFSAQEFLKSFVDKISDVRSSTSGSNPPNYSEYMGIPLEQFSEIGIEEVRCLIAKSPSKSCGLDPIPTWLLKDLAAEIAPYITVLFNKSISVGHFPLAFRAAEIKPILKKNSLDSSIITNYRPISNLSYLSKLCERAIKVRLLDHLDGNDLLPEHQSAYRACHSTESALLKITSDALMAADRGMFTLLGMLDLSAAFDCVDHEIFLCRLDRSFGIRGLALAWIRSYLDNRTQRVRYNGLVSESMTVLCGVPQGSVLGPLYFLCYTSGVFDIALKHGLNIHGYADDLQIYQHCVPSDMDNLNSSFTSCLVEIQCWMSSNRLRLNASKTEVLWLGSPKRLINHTPPPLALGGISIPLSSEVRSLGVVIDPSIAFTSHVSKVARTCYYHLRQLRSIRKSLTVDSCHALVRSLVISRLDYCNGLLGGSPKSLIGQLDSVLRASARLVLLRQRQDHITIEMREKLHWLDASARIKFKLCVFAFRCVNGSAPRYLSKLCVPVSTMSGRSRLRSAAAGELLVPNCSTKTIGPRAFAVSCPSAWNSLPANLRLPGIGLPVFRRHLKTELFRSMQ
jgi:hypothetical protein